jgi:hypothetical protein
VCSYLNDYKKSVTRPDDSKKFFKYLLSVCWPKLRQRISSWQGLGLICRLATYPKLSVDPRAFPPCPPTVDSQDNLLATFLAINAEMLQVLEESGPNFVERPVSFAKLVSAAKNWTALYTKETAQEFHDLLVITLATYAMRLNCFLDHHSKCVKKKAERDRDAKGLIKPFGVVEVFT